MSEAPTKLEGPDCERPFAFDNSYARLPERFFARLPPTPVAAPALVKLNEPLAHELGLDPIRLASPEGVAFLSGNSVPPSGEPLAMAYAGHQFGTFVPQLGDGRAILLGELIDRNGQRRDIQLKGSGPTPFSRRGDGRAVLGPVLREYIVSEAMSALGVHTTRSLAAVMTGEMIWRDTLLPGAVLTRVASSHIRVGTFQFFASREDIDGLRCLADYAIGRHCVEEKTAPNAYRAFLDVVIARQATLIARWMAIGFIHGVMNTDNTSISGETIDYGPCAFVDAYHPATVFSSIDTHGRYAYGNQPAIAGWNLARFAEALLPLLGDDEPTAVAEANKALAKFPAQFEREYLTLFRAKLGLLEDRDGDDALIRDVLDLMASSGADFTLTFRHLGKSLHSSDDSSRFRSLFNGSTALDAWLVRWRQRLSAEAVDPSVRYDRMCNANPLYIPRNHLVEEAIAAAVTGGDFVPFESLLAVLSKPFDEKPGQDRYAAPPRPDQVVRQTFCGT